MSERVTKTGSNSDHSQLVSNEIKSDNEGFSTLIRLSPEEAEYNKPRKGKIGAPAEEMRKLRLYHHPVHSQKQV